MIFHVRGEPRLPTARAEQSSVPAALPQWAAAAAKLRRRSAASAFLHVQVDPLQPDVSRLVQPMTGEGGADLVQSRPPP